MPTNFVNNLRLATDSENRLITTASGDAPIATTVSLATTIANAAVTVTDAATLVVAARTTRKALIIQNNSAGDIYIGGSGVTTSNGLKLAAGTSFSDYTTSAAWYGIVASSTANVRVVEVY